MAIHNGTFDLAMHTWYAPFDRITALARRAGVNLSTPSMGEPLKAHEPHTGLVWWLTVDGHTKLPVALGTART